MAEVLDQNEVDALLAAVGEGEVEVEVEQPVPVGGRVAVYDFKRPERVSKEQIRALETLHEVYARNLGAFLSGYLRTIVEIRVETVDQLTYSEFLMSLPNPTCFNLLTCEPLEGNMMLEINPSIVFPLIDRMLGGGKLGTTVPERPLTDIEWRLVGTIIDKAIEHLKTMWKNVKIIDFKVGANESNPQLIQVVSPNELVVLVALEISVGTSKGMMNLCIPFTVIEPIVSELTPHTWFGYARKGGAQDLSGLVLDAVREATLDVSCVVAESQLSVRDYLSLAPGDIIDLEKPANSPITVLVEGQPKFVATMGSYRRHVAVKIADGLESVGT
ncbi:MAG: flagellar motor switch protein FliM [Planctomycetota bacterium]|nr:flagellar motor switch protein FliM [Planctomycetota bacterium]